MIVSNSNNLNIYWIPYNNKVDFSNPIGIELDLTEEIDSISYLRKASNTFLLVYVSSQGIDNNIMSKEITDNELTLLKDSVVLPNENSDCISSENYIKDRCYNCRPGSVLVYYSSISAPSGFETSCLEVDKSISVDYLDA